MNVLRNMLLLVMCAGVTGSAPATEQSRSADVYWPAVVTVAQAAVVTYPGRGALSEAGILKSSPGVDGPIGAASRLRVAFGRGSGSARTTERTGTGARERVPAAAAAMPEPPGWMQLVCGLVFVVLMALRRARPSAD